MKKKIIMLCTTLVALILEILPYGAVCNFANPEGEPWVRKYSYFDLTPFGYANVGPFVTAILTWVLFMLLVIYAIKGNSKVLAVAKIFAWLAIVASFAPMFLGTQFYSLLGGFISLSLLTVLVAVRVFESKK